MFHLTSPDAGLLMAILSVVALSGCQHPSLAGGQRWFETSQYSAVPIEYSAAPCSRCNDGTATERCRGSGHLGSHRRAYGRTCALADARRDGDR